MGLRGEIVLGAVLVLSRLSLTVHACENSPFTIVQELSETVRVTECFAFDTSDVSLFESWRSTSGLSSYGVAKFRKSHLDAFDALAVFMRRKSS